MRGDSGPIWASALCGLSPLALPALLYLWVLSWRPRRVRHSMIFPGVWPVTDSEESDSMARPARPLGSRSLAVLCELLSHEDELVRAAACAELGFRGHEAARAVSKLARAAGYDDAGPVRGSASAALAAISTKGDGLEERVLEALQEERRLASYPESAFLAHAVELVELAVVSAPRA